MVECMFNLMLLMELFTFSHLNLKPWRLKTMKEAKNSWLNSYFSDVMMHKIQRKFLKKSKPR
jgi:hypothetical protein